MLAAMEAEVKNLPPGSMSKDGHAFFLPTAPIAFHFKPYHKCGAISAADFFSENKSWRPQG
jgi:hypothetical protein